jgi:hypothetical protein
LLWNTRNLCSLHVINVSLHGIQQEIWNSPIHGCQFNNNTALCNIMNRSLLFNSCAPDGLMFLMLVSLSKIWSWRWLQFSIYLLNICPFSCVLQRWIKVRRATG